MVDDDGPRYVDDCPITGLPSSPLKNTEQVISATAISAVDARG
jgi:hypothetical protein